MKKARKHIKDRSEHKFVNQGQAKLKASFRVHMKAFVAHLPKVMK